MEAAGNIIPLQTFQISGRYSGFISTRGELTLCLVIIISIIFILVHICLILVGLLPEFRVDYSVKMVPKFQLPQPISRQVLVYFR